MKRQKQGIKGYSLLELMITVLVMAILVAIAWPLLQQLMGLIRLNLAIWTLAQHWKMTRLDATGNGNIPMTLCMNETNEGVQFAQILGNNCESITSWLSLTNGVSIDQANSTLRTQSSVAGNGGQIYRVSWADTNAGLGGSWGQLGRLVLIADGTTAKKCLFLFDTDGSWNIRLDKKCNKS
ncbi:pilus assembly FimT family protein [Gloeothece verrucosa]|uniref:Prepilin-type N-terminal cleavage/methylation domain-containing protein n=1 Tax=Gloeothece verrucosa (strain PCC 7822) TaxID=497965 RepID=E0U5D0_GLOV7|nr:prepilin-type N-terminal cleavage/methylation domain-containing protein [Gloeothece verrucosa]ADN13520.1 conserved hypothetical protein [Gloeothece verrucosa PCC 7822]